MVQRVGLRCGTSSTCRWCSKNSVASSALGGRIALVDASEPDNAVLRFGHGLYFGKIVPLIGGLLSDKRAYGYLPRSLAYLPPRAELLEGLRRAGFGDVVHEQLTFGAAQLLTATRDHG